MSSYRETRPTTRRLLPRRPRLVLLWPWWRWCRNGAKRSTPQVPTHPTTASSDLNLPPEMWKTVLSFHRWGRRRRRRWRLWGWRWMGWLAFFLFFYFSSFPNPEMILTLHFVFLSKTEISNFKNISVNVLSSLYIFVAFVLFINLCNTSFNLSTLPSCHRGRFCHVFRLTVWLCFGHPIIRFCSPPPQTDGCRLCLRALFLCNWLTEEVFHQWCHHCWSQEEKKNYFHSLSRVSSLYLLIQMILVYRSYFLKATKGKIAFFFFFWTS